MTRLDLNALSQLDPSQGSKKDYLPARRGRWLDLFSGLLACSLVVSGCSGSKLGDTLGKSLEPDPQLADKASPVAAQPPDKTEKPADDVATNAAGDRESDQPTEAPAEQPESESTPVTAGTYTDLGKAPEELQPYLTDLLNLDLLKVRSPTAKPANPAAASNSSSSSSTAGAAAAAGASSAEKSTPAPPPKPDEFRPNQAVTRREYARWLIATNNRFYASQSNRKIRAGVTSSPPVFQDVSAKDPDFAAIQGLAEAGIIPSPLTGSSTTLTFRPDAPLTRQDMLLWKVPLDTRQPLPQATSAAVAEAWSFQDAGKIEPRALQAVLADYQNGDFSNIRRAFSYTTLFQPSKAATRAETAAVLWRFGNSTEGITAQDVLNPSSDQATDTPPAEADALGAQQGG